MSDNRITSRQRHPNPQTQQRESPAAAISKRQSPINKRGVSQSLGVSVTNVYVTRHRISVAIKKETRGLEKNLEQEAAH